MLKFSFAESNSKFISCNGKFKDSQVVIFGTPFDNTSSFRSGSRFAAEEIRQKSVAIETYSPYQNTDLTEFSIYDEGNLDLPFGNTLKSLEIIKNYSKHLIDNQKIPLTLGGEHLITFPIVEVLFEKYKDLIVICFDAHTDLRDDYLGEKLSHATVMRRIFDLTGPLKIYQFGVRSGEKIEFDFARDNGILIKRFNVNLSEDILEKFKNFPVYLSIDVDVLDPSVCPGTGTPEAGGVSFTELISNILKIKNNIVGADIVELCPEIDISLISTLLVAKLTRELLIVLNKNKIK